MNSNVFVSFGLILLVISYLLVYNFDPESEENMAVFIPDDAILYLEQRDFGATLNSFKNSRLGRNIEEIDFRLVGENVDLPVNTIELLELAQKKYEFLLGNKLYDELLGKRFGIAIFDIPKIEDPQDLVEYVLKNSIVIIEPRHNAQVLKLLAAHYSNYDENLSFQTNQYGNHHISRITTGKGIVSLSVIDGLIAASFNERQLKKSIDTYDREIPSLAEDAAFGNAFSHFNKPDRFIYLPATTVKHIASHILGHFSEGISELIEEQIRSLKGFTGLSYGAWSGSGVVEDKIIFSYDERSVKDSIRRYLSTMPGENTLLDFTTGEPLAYYWSNTVDLSHLLNYLESVDNTESPVYQYVQKLEQRTGKSLRKLLADLGDELSLVVEKSGAENFFPVPLGVLVFRLPSELEATELAENFVGAFNAPVIEQVYDSVTYLYWVASPQDGLQPLCGYWSNYLFIGNSAALLERIIDSFNNSAQLLTVKEIKKIDPGFTQTNNSITYFDNTDLIALTEQLLDAISTMLSLEDREKAERVRFFIREILIPILDGLKEYEMSCTRSYFAAGLIIIESKTAVNRNIQN